jgi:hypothetical protein
MGEETTRIREEIEGLRQMTVGQLKAKHREVFGEETRSNHKQFLFRPIAWRIQANAWGGLSERARQWRALETANDGDLRIRAPKKCLNEHPDERAAVEAGVDPTREPRLPLPGTVLVRLFQGKDVPLRTRKDGFECNGQGSRVLRAYNCCHDARFPERVLNQAHDTDPLPARFAQEFADVGHGIHTSTPGKVDGMKRPTVGTLGPHGASRSSPLTLLRPGDALLFSVHPHSCGPELSHGGLVQPFRPGDSVRHAEHSQPQMRTRQR